MQHLAHRVDEIVQPAPAGRFVRAAKVVDDPCERHHAGFAQPCHDAAQAAVVLLIGRRQPAWGNHLVEQSSQGQRLFTERNLSGDRGQPQVLGANPRVDNKPVGIVGKGVLNNKLPKVRLTWNA